MSTTITTQPINELQFPEVTVCPPRESNTVITHALNKVKSVNFTKDERERVKNLTNEMFLDIPNKKYAEQIAELLSIENIRSIGKSQAKMPEVDHQGVITMSSSALEGSYRTPGFGDSDYHGDFYKKSQSLHFILDLPYDIRDMVGDSDAFVISVQSGGKWSYRLQENRLQLYKVGLNHSEAEEFCVKRGGHLVSVSTQEEQDGLATFADGSHVWLGGKRGSDENWYWFDGKTWGFQQAPCQVSNVRCILASPSGSWRCEECTDENFYICAIPTEMTSHNKTFLLERPYLTSPSFHFWWNHNPANMAGPNRGFKISWKRNNDRLPDHRKFVTKELSGRVTTPGFGALPTPDHNKREHRFTAVIDLPYNITDVIGDDVFVVDVNVTSTGNVVKLLTTNLHYEMNNVEMSWFKAYLYCIKRGGILPQYPLLMIGRGFRLSMQIVCQKERMMMISCTSGLGELTAAGKGNGGGLMGANGQTSIGIKMGQKIMVMMVMRIIFSSLRALQLAQSGSHGKIRILPNLYASFL